MPPAGAMEDKEGWSQHQWWMWSLLYELCALVLSEPQGTSAGRVPDGSAWGCQPG